MRKPALNSIAILALAVSQAASQSPSHVRTLLIEGQRGSVGLRNATVGHTAWFVFGFRGAGPGLCIALPGPCLEFVGVPFIVPAGLVPNSGSLSFGFLLPRRIAGPPVSSQVVTYDPGAQRFGKTNAIHGTIQRIDALSDEFNGTPISSAWRSLHPALTRLRQGRGTMLIQSTRGGPAYSWFANGEGPFVYKEVTGDFDVSARVHTYRASQPARNPVLSFNLGGLCVRDPVAPNRDHDWVHLTAGRGGVLCHSPSRTRTRSIRAATCASTPSHRARSRSGSPAAGQP